MIDPAAACGTLEHVRDQPGAKTKARFVDTPFHVRGVDGEYFDYGGD